MRDLKGAAFWSNCSDDYDLEEFYASADAETLEKKAKMDLDARCKDQLTLKQDLTFGAVCLQTYQQLLYRKGFWVSGASQIL